MSDPTRLSCIRSQHLSGFNPRFFRIDIDPDTRRVAFTHGHEILVQKITSYRSHKAPYCNSKPSLVICLNQTIVAGLYKGEPEVYTVVEESHSNKYRIIPYDTKSTPRDCKVPSNAAIIVALYSHKASRTSTVVVFNAHDSSVISKWTLPLDLYIMVIPTDVRFVFVLQYSPGGWFLRKHHLYTGEYHSSIEMFPGPKRTRCVSGFSSDACAQKIVIADTRSLRIWQPQNSDSTIYHLPGYTPENPYDPKREFVLDMIPCAISRDGSRVVAAVAGNSLGIWDTVRRTRIATLAGHIDLPCKCAISTDGTTILSVGLDQKFCEWNMPTEETTGPSAVETVTSPSGSSAMETVTSPSGSSAMETVTNPSGSSIMETVTSPSPPKATTDSSHLAAASIPSPLETALVNALHNPSQLSESFLLKYVRSSNINSVSDLIAGHNLVLLAIRTRIITCDNIRRLGNSTWYLQDNLYHPASKLTIANAPIIDRIFQHAESVGIISNGYAFKIARSIRTDTDDNKRKLAQFLVDWLGTIDQRMSVLEGRASAVEETMSSTLSALGSISADQQNLNSAVQGLSESLDNLQAAIQKRDKIMKRVQVARCLLSFLPLVGKALGETAYTMIDVFMHLKLEDITPAAVDTAKTMLTEMFNVDLSNFRVAHMAFSSEMLSKLTEPARNAVTNAIAKSGFQSSDELQRILQDEIKSIGDADPSMALLDLGSSKWLRVQDGSSKSLDSVNSRSHDEGVRNFFKWKTHASKDRTMSIEEAKVEANNYLETCPGLSPVAPEMLETLFFDLASEDAEEVNEEVFVGMVLAVRKEQDAINQMKHLLNEYARRFRMRARPKKSLSLKFAARLICNISKEMVNQGVVKQAPMEYEQALQGLQKIDVDENRYIDEEEFLTAVSALLQREKGASGPID